MTEINDSRYLWVPVFELLQHSQFLHFQHSIRANMTVSTKPPVPVFVSHRWHSLHNPDPDGYQYLVVMRFLVESICYSRGLCDRFFSIGTYPVVSERFREVLRGLKTGWAADHTEWWNYLVSRKYKTTLLLRRFFGNHFPGLTLEESELEELSMCLDQIGVWYDYSCMPQRPFQTEAHKELFDWNLRNLNELISSSHTLIAWDEQSLDRAWCVYESAIALQENSFNVDIEPNCPANIHIQYEGGQKMCKGAFDLSEKISSRISRLRHCDPAGVEWYFRETGIHTTLEDDLPKVSELLSKYLM